MIWFKKQHIPVASTAVCVNVNGSGGQRFWWGAEQQSQDPSAEERTQWTGQHEICLLNTPDTICKCYFCLSLFHMHDFIGLSIPLLLWLCFCFSSAAIVRCKQAVFRSRLVFIVYLFFFSLASSFLPINIDVFN